LAGVADFDVEPLRTRAGDRSHFVHRKFAFRENGERFAPDISRGAHHCNSITHYTNPRLNVSKEPRKEKGRPGRSARTPFMKRLVSAVGLSPPGLRSACVL